MKYLAVIFLLFGCVFSSPKPPLSFKNVLKNAKEINFNDSLLLDFSSLPKRPLDTITGKKYWQIVWNNEKHMIHNAVFFTAGKITVHPKINLLLLGIERSSNGNEIEKSYGISQEIFLFILDKNGNYKGSRDVSSYWDLRENEKISYSEKLTSWLSKGFKLMRCIELRTAHGSIIYLDSNRFSHNAGVQLSEHGFTPPQLRELILDTLNH
jgi:hypothetical protein